MNFYFDRAQLLLRSPSQDKWEWVEQSTTVRFIMDLQMLTRRLSPR